MRFLYEIKLKIDRFMAGRNGIDRVNRGLIWIYLILFIVNMLSGGGDTPVFVSIGIGALMAIVLVVVLVRAFSRDIAKRRAECEKWSAFWWRFRTGNVDKNLTYKQAFKYITCERCGTTSRVPSGKGRIIVTCPKCQAKIPTET